MTTLYYWSTAIILFVFSTTLILPNKMEKKTFNTQIIDLQLKIEEYRKIVTKYKGYLEPEQLETAERLEKVFNQIENNIKTDELDISQPAFVNAVLQWRKVMLKEFQRVKEDYALVKIDPSKFSKFIQEENDVLPINVALYKEWSALVGALENPSTGKVVFDALINSKGKMWTVTANVESLAKHYNKPNNKKIYKPYEAAMIEGKFPKIELFIDAIKASVDPKDENLPNNKAEKKEKAIEREEFRTAFNDWKNNMLTELGEHDSLLDQNIVSILTVATKIDKALQTSERTSMPIIDFLKMEVNQFITSSEQGMTLAELKEELALSISKSENKIDWEAQFELWKKYKNNFTFPITTSFHTALKCSIADVSYQDFLDNVKELTLTNDNAKLIDIIAMHKKWEKVNDKKEVVFKKERLIKELKIAFSNPIKGVEPLSFIMKAIEVELLKNNDLISLDLVVASWNTGLQNAYAGAKNKSQNVYSNEWLKNHPIWKVEQVLDSMSRTFPNEATFAAVLEESRFYKNKKASKQLNSYNMSDAIATKCTIHWNSVPSLSNVVLAEGAEQSFISKAIDTIKSMGKGVELVVEELNGVTKIVNLSLPNFSFELNLPMKVMEYYDSKGAKKVTAIPSDFDVTNIKLDGDGGYYGFSVQRIYVEKERPSWFGNSGELSIEHQNLIVRTEIIDPQVSINAGAGIAGVELSKNPTKYTVDFRFTIRSVIDMKGNDIRVDILKLDQYLGGGAIIDNATSLENNSKRSLKIYK